MPEADKLIMQKTSSTNSSFFVYYESEDAAKNTPAKENKDRDIIFEATWKEIKHILYRKAFRLTNGNGADAEDLMATTAIKAIKFLRHSPELVHHPQGFLFLVLQHVYLDFIRRKQREDRLFERCEDISLSPHVVSSGSLFECLRHVEQLEQISTLIDRLPPAQQQLFDMIFIKEHTYEEVTEKLGISQSLARKRVQLLRELFRPLNQTKD